MTRALFVVDIQNDFTEGGALGVAGGDAVARGVTRLWRERPHAYPLILASRDWHDADNDNGGHFSPTPDYRDTWPVHCLADTDGAAYDPLLNPEHITHHVKKGQGVPAYSAFEGTTAEGEQPAELLTRSGVQAIDIVGIATDHCVRATALDARRAGFEVRLVTDLVAGVAEASSQAALNELVRAGATLITSNAL